MADVQDIGYFMESHHKLQEEIVAEAPILREIEAGTFFIPDDPNRVTGWVNRGDYPGRPLQD